MRQLGMYICSNWRPRCLSFVAESCTYKILHFWDGVRSPLKLKPQGQMCVLYRAASSLILRDQWNMYSQQNNIDIKCAQTIHTVHTYIYTYKHKVHTQQSYTLAYLHTLVHTQHSTRSHGSLSWISYVEFCWFEGFFALYLKQQQHMVGHNIVALAWHQLVCVRTPVDWLTTVFETTLMFVYVFLTLCQFCWFLTPVFTQTLHH